MSQPRSTPPAALSQREGAALVAEGAVVEDGAVDEGGAGDAVVGVQGEEDVEPATGMLYLPVKQSSNRNKLRAT